MCKFLVSIGLSPLLFEDAVIKSGKTSPYIGEVLETAFSLAQAVVVLMTPDDEGCLCANLRGQNEPIYETQPTPQARINVYFEAGWALGGSHRDRTILVQLGDLRPFSDISGRHKVVLTNSLEKRKDLIGRLKNARCSVDISGDDWKNAGDFSIESRIFSFPNPPSVELEKKDYSKEEKFKVDNYGITNEFLDKLYEYARSITVSEYDDAVLSDVNIQFIPWDSRCGASIFLKFYSKDADKKRKYIFSLNDKQLIPYTPDEFVTFDHLRKTFEVLPWKRNSNWIDFIKKYYTKVGPITPSQNSSIQLSPDHFLNKKGFEWNLSIKDGLTGRTYQCSWNGGKLNDQNVKCN